MSKSVVWECLNVWFGAVNCGFGGFLVCQGSAFGLVNSTVGVACLFLPVFFRRFQIECR